METPQIGDLWSIEFWSHDYGSSNRSRINSKIGLVIGVENPIPGIKRGGNTDTKQTRKTYYTCLIDNEVRVVHSWQLGPARMINRIGQFPIDVNKLGHLPS